VRLPFSGLRALETERREPTGGREGGSGRHGGGSKSKDDDGN
jgi:hypothetical protein